MGEEESQEPRRVERRLLIRIIPAEMLADTEELLGGGLLLGKGDGIDLGDDIEERYLSDWLPTSHTFSILSNGNGLLTVLMERLR